MRRCGSGGGARAKFARGGRRCDSVRVFCEAGVDRAFRRISVDGGGEWGWKGRMEGATRPEGEDEVVKMMCVVGWRPGGWFGS